MDGVNAINAIRQRGRYWMRKHKWGGWHVIDSSKSLPISRLMGNFMSPIDAWVFIKGLPV